MLEDVILRLQHEQELVLPHLQLYVPSIHSYVIAYRKMTGR